MTDLPVQTVQGSQILYAHSPRSNAWARPSASPLQTSLADVMSEQLVSHLEHSDKLDDVDSSAIIQPPFEKINSEDFQTNFTEEEQNDALIAQVGA